LPVRRQTGAGRQTSGANVGGVSVDEGLVARAGHVGMYP
jgi:hypothetical protein